MIFKLYYNSFKFRENWKHLGQFGGLDIKTSQEPKLRKNGKLGILVKFRKGDIKS